MRVGVDLQAPGTDVSKAGPAEGAERRGSPQGWLPGSAGKRGVDPIPSPIPAAVGTSGERGAGERRLQRTHGNDKSFQLWSISDYSCGSRLKAIERGGAGPFFIYSH